MALFSGCLGCASLPTHCMRVWGASPCPGPSDSAPPRALAGWLAVCLLVPDSRLQPASLLLSVCVSSWVLSEWATYLRDENGICNSPCKPFSRHRRCTVPCRKRIEASGADWRGGRPHARAGWGGLTGLLLSDEPRKVAAWITVAEDPDHFLMISSCP